MTDGSSQTVVLTGAAGGMGRAITKALIESGRRDAGVLQKQAPIARSIVFALDQPAHAQIAEMMILPVNRY